MWALLRGRLCRLNADLATQAVAMTKKESIIAITLDQPLISRPTFHRAAHLGVQISAGRQARYRMHLLRHVINDEPMIRSAAPQRIESQTALCHDKR